VSRDDIQQAIADYVEGLVASGEQLHVNVAAFHLSSEHPQSGFHLQQLCEMIMAAAKDRGLGIANDRCV
jgi:hypothetical protein